MRIGREPGDEDLDPDAEEAKLGRALGRFTMGCLLDLGFVALLVAALIWAYAFSGVGHAIWPPLLIAVILYFLFHPTNAHRPR